MSDNLPKANHKLSEAQKYYIGLFEKWQKLQVECPEKLPEGYRTKEEFDFEKLYIDVLNSNLVEFSEAYLEKLFVLDMMFGEKNIKIYDLNYFGDLGEQHDNYEDFKIMELNIKNKIIHFCDNILDFTFINCEFDGVVLNSMKMPSFVNCSGNLILNKEEADPRVFEIDDYGYMTDCFLEFYDCKFNRLVLNNFNLTHIEAKTKNYLIKSYKLGKVELNNSDFPEIENLKLQNELEVYKQNNQLSSNRIKVFHFNQTLLGDYKASFAEYFMGLKDFILYSQGKNIGVDIRLNGSLELKIYSDNEQDLDSIRLSINDYVNNLLNPNDEPKIHSGVNAVDPQKALILIKAKLNNLETSLQLKNSQLIANENLIKYLKEVALDIQSKNEELQSQNKQLASQLDETISVINNLKFQLTQIKVKELNSNDQIDIVINLLGTLTLIINQKESTKLTKQIINQLSDFEKVNREFFEKIRLPEVDFKIGEVDLRANLTTISISDLLQQIITKLYRNF